MTGTIEPIVGRYVHTDIDGENILDEIKLRHLLIC